MTLAEQQQQQLAFNFEPGFDAAHDELEDDNFADDPEFYNTGDFPSVRLTLDEIPFDQRRRVLRLRPGVIPTIACAFSGIVRAAQHAISSAAKPAAPAPTPESTLTSEHPAKAAPTASASRANTGTAELPEPSLNVEAADPTPKYTVSQRDFIRFIDALRQAFIGLPDQWRHALELADRFLATYASPEPAPHPAT